MPNWKTWWCVLLVSVLVAFYGTMGGPDGVTQGGPAGAVRDEPTYSVALSRIVGAKGHLQGKEHTWLGFSSGRTLR